MYYAWFTRQDKDEEKDEANCAKLNQLLNSSAADEPSSIAEQPLSAIAGGGGAPAGMNPDQWMQMLGLPPGQQAAAAAANHVPTATSIAPNSTLGSLDLSSLLGNTAPATSFANA